MVLKWQIPHNLLHAIDDGGKELQPDSEWRQIQCSGRAQLIPLNLFIKKQTNKNPPKTLQIQSSILISNYLDY